MAARLEKLDPGTPVFLGEKRVGTVRAVYAEGDGKLAEYLAIRWTSRDTDVLIATREVETIEDRGVVLQGADASAYDLPAFHPEDHPTIRQIH